ncbi:hypothetical protein ACFPMF_19275 [Larkinella bovis]|uniref:Uncharacterized protein n=1 Tax=Larkinella bovis TaxID=683041 RepID=A0ABW0IFF2_9BACT
MVFYHRPRQNSPSRLITYPIERSLVKYSFVALLLLLTFPYLEFVQIPTPGIDNSWRIALELLQEKHLVWGQDILFTYGPLGRWLQRYSIVTTPTELLLVDIFFLINVACLFYSFLPNPLKVWHTPVYFLIWAVINSMWGEWIHFTWFFIVIYWGLKSIRQPAPNRLLLCYVSFVCAINFFMKVNFGVLAIGFMISLLAFLYANRQLTWAELIAMLGFLGGLLGLGAYWLHTDLRQYVVSSFYIIDGYNESQAIFPENRLRLVALSYGSFLLQLLAVGWYMRQCYVFPYKRKDLKGNLFTLFWVLGLSFIVLKYAFTRADDGHITAYVKQSSLLLVLVVVCVQQEWIQKTFALLLLLNCGLYLLFYVPIFGKVPVNYGTVFAQKLHFFSHYLKTAGTAHYPVPKPTIPASIRQEIKNQTIDVIPNDIAEVYFNGLNYNPRPTLQSYQSYNAYLDRKNREKYLSPSAPDWIIYRYEALDGKYPLADETQTLLAILQRYRPLYQSDGRLFLKKDEQPKTVRLIRQHTIQLQLGEKLRLTDSDSLLHILYAKPHYNGYGMLLNLLFQPPQMTMQLGAEDQTTVSYRVVPALLKKGLLITSRVDNVKEMSEFIATTRVSNKRLTELCFQQSLRPIPGFTPGMEITIQSFQLGL